MYDLSSSSFLKSSISQKEQFSNGAILKWSISQMEHFSNGAILKSNISQMEHFSNEAILKSNISQMEHFSNGAILKWSNSQMEHFSNGANWGRHHQLDDSLVGQLTNLTYVPFIAHYHPIVGYLPPPETKQWNQKTSISTYLCYQTFVIY